MDGIESPVTGVAPKSDSPKVSRVRVFKRESERGYENVYDRRGVTWAENPSLGYEVFSLDEHGNPIGHAEAEVEGAKTITTWHPHHLGDHQVPDDEGYVQDGEERRPASEYERRLKNDEHYKKTGQPPLFYVDSDLPKFSGLFSTSKNSSGLPSYLLGAIGKQFRDDITYDENLTPYSAKMVHRAGGLGMIKENPHFPFKDVEKLAKSTEGVNETMRTANDWSLVNTYRDKHGEELLDEDEAIEDYDLNEALDYRLREAKTWTTELPEDEVKQLPNVLKDAIKTSKAEKAAAVAQPAVASKEDSHWPTLFDEEK